MANNKRIYSGKAKDIYETDQAGVLLMVYKNQATAGNGAKKEEIAGKGVLNQAITNKIFTYLAQNGIPTHLIKDLGQGQELVKQLTMFPLEVVCRNYAAGSLVKRLGVEKGIPIEGGMVEYFYKRDDLNDPFVNEANIYFLEAANPEQLKIINDLTLAVNQLLIQLFHKAGLKLVDFKLEFGETADGEIVLADEFSPDNARLWDEDTLASFDKDIFRNDQGDIIPFYQEVLNRLVEVLG
ncbi:phosphoribosylaminoimidazolesuccinocarboxamide synthase [Hutsoniella sourekii]